MFSVRNSTSTKPSSNRLVAWLEEKQVNFVKGAVVQDIGFAESSGRLTADRLDIPVG